MQRIASVTLIALAMLVGSARSADAQTTASAGWAGTKAASTHGDELRVAVAIGLWTAGHLDIRPAGLTPPAFRQPQSSNKTSYSLVAEFRVGHEWDGGATYQGLGGLRMTNNALLKWPCYLEVTGGVVHFEGATNGIAHPGAGVMFPIGGARSWIFVQGGAAIIFFSGNTEVGGEASAGVTFKLGK